MTQDIFSTWTTMGQNSFETLKKLGELNIKISEKLLKEQIALTETMLEAGTKTLDAMGDVKDPQEGVTKQTAVAEKYGKKMQDGYRSCAEILEEAGVEYKKLFEAGVDAANKTVKTATVKSKAA